MCGFQHRDDQQVCVVRTERVQHGACKGVTGAWSWDGGCLQSFPCNFIWKQNRAIRESRYPKCQKERFLTGTIKYINTYSKMFGSIQSGQGDYPDSLPSFPYLWSWDCSSVSSSESPYWERICFNSCFRETLHLPPPKIKTSSNPTRVMNLSKTVPATQHTLNKYSLEKTMRLKCRHWQPDPADVPCKQTAYLFKTATKAQSQSWLDTTLLSKSLFLMFKFNCTRQSLMIIKIPKYKSCTE